MILVTGATGLLGAELVRQLTDRGLEVRATKRKSSILPFFLKNNKLISWIDFDLLDFSSLQSALDGVSKVYHCAAMISFQKADKATLFEVNITGTANLVNLCLEQNIRLLQVSSVAALGEARQGKMIDESCFWEYQPRAQNYALSKYRSEMEVWRGIAEGLDAVIVNPSIILGKNTGYNGSGAFFKTVKNGLKFYTEGSMGFVDVEDVASCMVLLMESQITAERFIINAANWPYKDLLSQIAGGFKLKAPSIKLSSKMMRVAWRLAKIKSLLTGKPANLTKETAESSIKKLEFSNQKIKNTLNFNFKPIKQSITEICDAINK